MADFLQLGSWLPCQLDATGAQSLLGRLDIDTSSIKHQDFAYLLVKPSQLLLDTEVAENHIANAQVDYISVTEQGYHYYLSSLESSVSDQTLSFNKLSLYSDSVLSLKQQVSVSVKAHDFLFFQK